MKTNILMLIAAFFMLFTSCSEKQATEFTYDDYLSLQSDDDWVEIMDIDTVYHFSYVYGSNPLKIGNYTSCLNQDKIEHGAFLKNIQDLEKIFDGVPLHNPDAELNCSDSLQPFIDNSGIDFNERDYFVNFIQSGPLNFKRSVFINKKDKIVQYVVELKQNEHSGKYILLYWREFIGIPKIPDGYTVKIDILNIPFQ